MGTEEAAAARFPARRRLAGGGGGVLGQELAEIYLGVGAVVDGDGRSRGSGGAQGAAAAAVAGGGAPAVQGGGERPGSFTESGRSYLVGPLEAREGGEGAPR